MKWYCILLASILLATAASSTDYYYVGTESSESCADYTPCDTLQYYASNQSKYFTNDTNFIFLPGTHKLSENISVNSINSLKFASFRDGSAKVVCNGLGGLTITHAKNIQVANLTFISCGQPLPDSLQRDGETAQAALAFGEVTDLLLDSVSVSHSAGYGLLGHCVHGNFIITQSVFSFNKGSGFYLGGNAAIEYTNCSEPEFGVHSTLNITHSNFTDGDYENYTYTHYSGTLATGLSLILSQINTKVWISNVLMHNNKNSLTYKGFGGNMFIHFYNKSDFTSNNVTISRSKFTGGTAWLGAGVGTTFYAVPVNKSVSEGNCSDFLKLNDVEISDNTGIIGSGLYFQFQMRHPRLRCPYANVHAFNVTFNNNSLAIPTRDQSYFIGNGIAVQIVVKYHKNLNTERISNHYQVIFENCSFSNSSIMTNRRDDLMKLALPSITTFIVLNANNQTVIKNCKFLDNHFPGIGLQNSMVTFSGDILIKNNRGLNGGGVLLCESSVVNLASNTAISFINNSATHKGGGVYVEDNCFHTKPFCFYQLANQDELNCTEYFTTVSVAMINNTAGYAGDHIYGGALDNCKINDCASEVIFRQVFRITPNTTNSATSAVTSNPTRICFCNENKLMNPNKMTLYYPHELYPGEPINVSVAILGQLNGTVPGTIQEYSSPNSVPIPHIIGKRCKKILLTVQGNQRIHNITLKLSTDIDDQETSGTEPYLTASRPLKVTIPIKSCPPGFSLNKSNLCDCNTRLNILSDNKLYCNIAEKYISRTSPSWIGFSNKSDKVISPGIVYHKSCPIDYCNDKNVFIYVSSETTNQDSQCAPNRTGLLCSKCNEGLSLSMGTSDCLECTTDVGIAFTFIGYGLLGIVTVLILIAFNITITDGTLSGLLFYANTIELNRSIFLPSGDHNILTILISSMNLRLGIKTCLFNGMNAYYKAWMGFCFPVYLLTIITAIIVLCRMSTRISNLLSGNIIKVLATLIQLFYVNLTLTVVKALSFTEVQYPSAIMEYKSVLVWLYDPHLEYFQGKHVPLALVAIVFGLLILTYTLVLLFIQPLQRYSHLCCFTWVAKLKPLIDAYTSPHIIKDNCRYWEGLLLFCRLGLSVGVAVNITSKIENNLNAITIACTLLITIIWATGGIYKKWHLNILNFLSIVNLGVTSAVLSSSAHLRIYQRKQLSTKTMFKITVYTSFIVASIILLGVLLLHVYRRVLLWHLKYKRLHYQPLASDTRENLHSYASENN